MARHQHNRQFFDQLTLESCYWAGFIAADGCIDQTNQGLILALSESDLSQVEGLKHALSSTSPVLCRDTSNGYREARLSIYGARECLLALKRYFNITPAKSRTLEPPCLGQERDVRAFIRGYLDGDGSISQTGKNGHWQVSLIGTQAILEWIKTQLKYYVITLGNPSVLPDRKVFQINFHGPQTRSLLDWLYRDSTPTTRLSRKYDRYLRVCQRYT